MVAVVVICFLFRAAIVNRQP
eukprot:COSAG02_NODE_58493_length_277_cov_0.584270_1_plen_20_part_10